MRETLTISVPTEDIAKVREIRKFCKDHRLNLSGLIVQRLISWYDKNGQNIQKLLYKLNKEST